MGTMSEANKVRAEEIAAPFRARGLTVEVVDCGAQLGIVHGERVGRFRLLRKLPADITREIEEWLAP